MGVRRVLLLSLAVFLLPRCGGSDRPSPHLVYVGADGGVVGLADAVSPGDSVGAEVKPTGDVSARDSVAGDTPLAPDVPVVACVSDSDCLVELGDLGSCARAVCDRRAGVCVSEGLEDGTACDDGDACTAADACSGGACVGRAVDCSDDDPCTVDWCQVGTCRNDPAPDGTPCGSLGCDGLDWVRGTCVAGVCGGTEQVEGCDDGLACTVDGCDPAQGCVHEPSPSGTDCGVCSACDGAGACIDDLDQDVDCGVCEECGPGGSCSNQPAGRDDKDDCGGEGFCSGGGGVCDGEGACLGGGALPVGAWCDGDVVVWCDAGGIDGGRRPCPVGCVDADGDARCLQMIPSNNVGDLLCAGGGTLVIDGDAEADTDRGRIYGVAEGEGVGAVFGQNGTQVELFVAGFDAIRIEAGATLRVRGSRALVLVSCGDVQIDGVIDLRAEGSGGGPGGFDGGRGSGQEMFRWHPAEAGLGCGAGGGGASEDGDPYRQSGGGGGGLGGIGGSGGAAITSEDRVLDGGTGGPACGAPLLIPLFGGGGGGGAGAFNDGGSGGGGGGALQITAGGTIVVGASGAILLGGAGGAVSSEGNWGAGGGGGAGGAVLLEAPTVTVDGALAANGGGGGGARTEYEPWDLYCPEGTPTPGDAGAVGERRARGGDDCSGDDETPAGAGGEGGAGPATQANGGDGDEGRASGGGGGAVGRIRINVRPDDLPSVSSVTSPSCSPPGAACTFGTLTVY